MKSLCRETCRSFTYSLRGSLGFARGSILLFPLAFACRGTLLYGLIMHLGLGLRTISFCNRRYWRVSCYLLGFACRLFPCCWCTIPLSLGFARRGFFWRWRKFSVRICFSQTPFGTDHDWYDAFCARSIGRGSKQGKVIFSQRRDRERVAPFSKIFDAKSRGLVDMTDIWTGLKQNDHLEHENNKSTNRHSTKS